MSTGASSHKKAERALQEVNLQLEQRIEERTAELARANAALRDQVEERERAEKAVREEADRLAAVVKVQYEIARAELDPTKVMQLIVNRTCELSHADRCVIWLVDDKEMVCRAATGEATYAIGTRKPLASNLGGVCIQTGEIVDCPDTSKDPRADKHVMFARKARSVVAVPIHYGLEIAGAFAVVSKKPNAFDQNDVQLLQLMAGLISTAMEHATQFQERREAELDLQRILAQTEQVLISIPSILIEIDEAGQITTWNTAAKAAFGLSRDDVLGRPLAECGIGWESSVLQGIEICKRDHHVVRLDDIRLSAADGKDRLLGVTINPITTSGGTSIGILILAADVTERRMLESQLAQSQKLESIGQLAAGIAHEINTPIQYVGDNIRFLRDAFDDLMGAIDAYGEFADSCKKEGAPAEMVGKLDEAVARADLAYLVIEVPSAITHSLEGVQRVAHIVGAMKEFSHPGTSEKTPIDLNHAIESTITVARNEWKYVADVITDLDPDLPLVPCLPADLNQVFLNLIINAAHAVGEVVRDGPGEKGSITVRTRNLQNCVEIAIEDTGAGIPEAIRSRLFDPFFTTKSVGKGTGQGLAIARSVVVGKHGGTIDFDTEIGKGTTFRVRIPLPAAENAWAA